MGKRRVLVVFYSLIILLSYFFLTGNEDIKKLTVSLLFVSVYVIILWRNSRHPNKKNWLKIGLIILVSMEVIVINYSSINSRSVKTDKTISGVNSYIDGTELVLEYLKGNDSSEFYRIDKQYSSVFLCDALAQNYYGIKNYVGFTENSGYIGEFYQVFGLPKLNGNHFLFPSSIINEINTILGVKYILALGDIANFGYDKIATIENINIYRNNYDLPLGFVYNKYIEEREFKKLNFKEKRIVLLEAAIVENKIADIEKFDLLDINDFAANERVLVKHNNSEINFEPLLEGEVLIINLWLNNSSKIDGRGSLSYTNSDNKTISYDLAAQTGKNEYSYELNAQGISQLVFSFPEGVSVEKIEVYKEDSEIYNGNYIKKTAQLNERGFRIDKFTSTEIHGTISTEKDGILFLSIPYNKNWKLFIDGESVPIKDVNIGFIGAEISKGIHEVSLYYDVRKNDIIYFILILLGIIICIIGVTSKKFIRIIK